MTHVNFDDDDIGVRAWRPKPPLRLRAKRKLQIRWCRVKCTRCPHMRAVATAPSVIRWGDYARQQDSGAPTPAAAIVRAPAHMRA